MPSLSLPFIAHGGDYNPDQWLDRPDILEEDIRLMKKARCNVMSVGIFAWSALEPEEGRYEFGWLRDVLDRLHENGISVFLATPSGARPAWMSRKYPEVLRVDETGRRNLHGGRHNHCLTSPVYRQFVAKMDGRLAEAFGHHPAVVGWHISNEYGGECHCPQCQEAFRAFLKKEYGTLEALNKAWWTGFWSHTYDEWDELHSPSPIGENGLHGLSLAWQRFVTRQTKDFMHAEIAAIRQYAPELPVTTNLMEFYGQLDYFELSRDLDFVSYDSYPKWGTESGEDIALYASFNYDLMRSMKKQPFVLMESTPSQVNWAPVCKLKKPGMHRIASLQALAHGADAVMYFQWRKSRGASEKFHGAVVDHVGHEDTRTFRDVADVGECLEKLSGVKGCMPDVKAALLFDTENRWAIDLCQGPRREKHYVETVRDHYRALKRQGIEVDVIDETCGFEGYRLIVAPMLYMLRPGVAERLEAFVREGGTLLCTTFTGRVDRDDLCFLGGFPGPLRDTLGIWIEETDALMDGETNAVAMGGREYACLDMCDLIHAETAEVVGEYASDFYAGMPAVTRNSLGRGAAWYLAARGDQALLDALTKRLVDESGVRRLVDGLPEGVQVTTRGQTLFVMNFNAEEARVALPEGVDMLTGERMGGPAVLRPLRVLAIKTAKGE